MKKKALVLIALLGFSSLAACDARSLFEDDVKDWDTPLKALSFANYNLSPLVTTSDYAENGRVKDSKKVFKERLETFEYTTKASGVKPTTEKYFEYHITSPYFEYVSVDSADLRIYRDGFVYLKVNTSETRWHGFYFTTDESNGVSIYNEAVEYLNEAEQLKKACDTTGEIETTVTNFFNEMDKQEEIHGKTFVNRLEYGFTDDGSVLETMKSVEYTEKRSAGSNDFGNTALTFDDTVKAGMEEHSQLKYLLNESHTIVRIENRFLDRLDRSYYFYKDYSVSKEAGDSIYEAAFTIIRAKLGV